MLYYNFRNYEEFKDRFGIQHHGNGVKSRKNKILLSYLKDPTVLHKAVSTGNFYLLHISDMAELKRKVTAEIRRSGYNNDDLAHAVEIMDEVYRSALYYTDDYQGLCEDGDFRSFRYVNAENGRVFKMKIGKFFRKIILETSYGQTLPEQVVTYLCEEMAQDWQTHAMSSLPKYKLFVGKDFRRIYDSDYLEGRFDSCMVDKGYHSFYENAVDASAAYIENEKGKIIARCVIFNKVKDHNGKIRRLAERQYSSGQNDVLKRILVDALIKEGYIDGYKTVGAGCGDASAFVDNEGNSLSHLSLSIECDLDFGDDLSYQDSFKHYDMDSRIATNYGRGDYQLDITEGELEEEDREWDDYHECNCRETTTVYYRGREMWCDSDRLDDFRWIESNNEYHHYEDVSMCDECGDYYLSDDCLYSDLTEEYYCRDHCRNEAETRHKEENWTYSDYDNEYFEDSDDVTEYFSWNSSLKRYLCHSISQDSLDHKIDEGDFYMIDDVAYDAIDEETGLPFSNSISLGTDTVSTIAA